MYRDETSDLASAMPPLPPASPTPTPTSTPPERLAAIGSLISRTEPLTPEQLERIANLQRVHGLRFGEAAVAAGLASEEDVVHALSRQFNYPYQPQAASELPAELVMARAPFSPRAEAFRGIRAQLKMRVFRAGVPRRAVAVVSAADGDGKSHFAANIAVAFSQLGGRTLLIDADLRAPRQHQLFGVDDASGLSNVLSGRSESLVMHPVRGLPNLFVLPVGAVPPNPMELVEGEGFAALLAEVLGKFDHVVVDTPAFAHGMDAPVIAAACGAALVVVRKGRSRTAAVQDLVALIGEGPAEVAGVVLNHHG